MVLSRWISIWRTDTGSSYNLVTENDINVISAAAVMFSGTPNPLSPASTLPTWKNTIMYKPEVLITQKRKQISTRSQGLLQCFGHSKSGCAQIDGVRLQKTASGANIRFWLFYFRFVPDAVLRSRILSKPVEVYRACPKTLPQPLWAPWCRFLSQSYNYFRYPSAILELLYEGSVVWGWHIHQWKTCPKT